MEAIYFDKHFQRFTTKHPAVRFSLTNRTLWNNPRQTRGPRHHARVDDGTDSGLTRFAAHGVSVANPSWGSFLLK